MWLDGQTDRQTYITKLIVTFCSFPNTSRKSEVYLTIGHEGAKWEKRNNFAFSLTLALDRGGWLVQRPGYFTTGKETWYPL